MLLLLQVGGDSLRAFATFITPNLSMGRWSFYIIFGAVQLMLSLVSDTGLHSYAVAALLRWRSTAVVNSWKFYIIFGAVQRCCRW